MSKLTLQKKYIAFLITTLLLVLLLNGVLFSQLFANRSTAEHQQKIYHSLEALHEELNSLEQQTLKVSHALSTRQDILSSINLINRYQDINNYQPLIFDVEKENLAIELALSARTADIDMVMLLDQQERIVAFYLGENGMALKGYISYEKGKRNIIAAVGDSDTFLPYSRPLPTILLSPNTDSQGGKPHVHLIIEQNSLYSSSASYLHASHVDGSEQRIGRVIIAKEISVKELTSTVAHLGVEFSMYLSGSHPTNQIERLYLEEEQPPLVMLEESHKSGHRDHPLISRGGYLLGSAHLPIHNMGSGVLIVGLQRVLIDKQILDFRYSALIVLLITALFITPLAIYLMNRGLLHPIKRLTDGVHKLREGEYIKVEGAKGDDELGELATSFNNMIDELERRDDQLRTLSMATEQSPASILITSPDGLIEYVNPQFEKQSGFSASDVIGQSMELLYQYSEMDREQIEELNTIISSGDKWSGEAKQRNKSGELYSLRIAISPIKTTDGSISHYLYITEDITEQKRGEEILRGSQKMDAVGQLTGGIAHDFNNILGIITGNLELLKMGLNNQPDEQEKIERALSGARRGAQLIRKLLNFSRQDNSGQELTQINPFIENMRELIAKSITAIIQVETLLADDLWSVEIDPGDLEDAILNLSLNARDAMPGGGLLVIETANKHLDANYAKQHPNAHEGDYVMVSVSDTGAGIGKEARKKIFDPFFSTKELGKGTGLGLSMVYGFVQRSGGHIQLYSEEGMGSTFHIYLPRAVVEHGKQDEQSDEEQSELPRGDEKILIVDDEKQLSEVAESYLQQLGYQTLVANNGKEALDTLSKTEGIDLIFSDVVMPGGLDGYHLAFAAAKQQPTVKVLLTSGFTSKREEFTNGEQKIYLKLAANLLGKPYNLRELALAIRQVLDKQDA